MMWMMWRRFLLESLLPRPGQAPDHPHGRGGATARHMVRGTPEKPTQHHDNFFLRCTSSYARLRGEKNIFCLGVLAPTPTAQPRVHRCPYLPQLSESRRLATIQPRRTLANSDSLIARVIRVGCLSDAEHCFLSPFCMQGLWSRVCTPPV